MTEHTTLANTQTRGPIMDTAAAQAVFDTYELLKQTPTDR